MKNLIVFGSLLHPEELKKHNISMQMIEYVKVYGFKRIFNQEPSWRKVESIYRAVMNIEYDEDSWFNALVIKGITKEYIEDLDHRERGYDRLEVQNGQVITYQGKILKDCIVYKGKEGKQNSEILPNKQYFEICLEGARCHFDDFYKDYICTTYKYNNSELYLLKNDI